MSNGKVINQQNQSDNVGRYEFLMLDSLWTKVDQDPEHHTGSHFNQDDCTPKESYVPNNDTTLNNNNIGCNISSKHTNSDRPTIEYFDYEVHTRPYDFNLTAVIFKKGIISQEATIGNTNAFIYNSDILTGTDVNMSVRYTGRLRAVGADQNSLSNFVQNCWANDVNLTITNDITTVNPAPESTTIYALRLIEIDNTGSTINDTIQNQNTGGSSAVVPVTLPANNFIQDMNGEAEIQLNANFLRNIIVPVNPIILNYQDFQVECSDSSKCESEADLETPHEPQGIVTNNQSVTHVYGRVHTPRQRSNTPNITVPTNYEFYCNSATGCAVGNYALVSPQELLSPDAVRWYNLPIHNNLVDGDVTSTNARNEIDNGDFDTMQPINNGLSAQYIYNNKQGYPYKTTINLNTENWLIYHRYNANANANTFELEFYNAGNWGGLNRSKIQSDSNVSGNTTESFRLVSQIEIKL